MPDQEEKETIHIVSDDFVEVKGFSSGSRGTNDYHNQGLDIDKIVDSGGRDVTLTWNDDWVAVSPGIETCRGKRYSARIHRSACPVRIRFADWYEYVSYDDYAHNSSWRHYFWVRYEAESSE